MHKAIRTIRMGRGYGRMLVPVVDMASFSAKSKTLHIIGQDRRPLCGVRGQVHDVLDGCDPKAEVVLRRPVCVTCRERLGAIPAVEFLKDTAAA